MYSVGKGVMVKIISRGKLLGLGLRFGTLASTLYRYGRRIGGSAGSVKMTSRSMRQNLREM